MSDEVIDEKFKMEIQDQAAIFRKTTNRPLTEFQVCVNDAAFELALSQPDLLRKGNRGILLDRKASSYEFRYEEAYSFKNLFKRN